MRYNSTASNRSGVEKHLSIENTKKLAWRIFDRLYDQMLEMGGTKFGIDLPTMKVLYPREFRVINRLKKAGEAQQIVSWEVPS